MKLCIMPLFVVESDIHDFFNKFLISVYIVAWTPVEVDISSDGKEY